VQAVAQLLAGLLKDPLDVGRGCLHDVVLPLFQQNRSLHDLGDDLDIDEDAQEQVNARNCATSACMAATICALTCSWASSSMRSWVSARPNPISRRSALCTRTLLTR